ncbi:MAG: hypothetical protein ABSE73_11870, partial [Planctomycetota bacterium]
RARAVGGEFHVEYVLAVEEATVAVQVWSRPGAGPQGEQPPAGTKTFDLAWDLEIRSAQQSIRIRQNTTEARDLGIALDDGAEKRHPAVKIGAAVLRAALLKIHALIDKSHAELFGAAVFSWFIECAGAWRFDEALGIYEALMSEGHATIPPPRLIFKRLAKSKPQGIGSYSREFLPSALLAPLVARLESRWENGEPETELQVTGADAPDFLKQLAEVLEFKAAGLCLSCLRKKSEETGEVYVYGDLRFRFVAQDGSEIVTAALSHGQKRLLAFYYYLAVNPSVVVADELANGFQHDWFSACLSALGARQAFLSSPDPLLLDFMPLESAEQAQHNFIFCRLKEHAGRQALHLENISLAQAKELYEAHDLGMQHLGEMLKAQGLW